jgi:hypothetical protein
MESSYNFSAAQKWKMRSLAAITALLRDGEYRRCVAVERVGVQ